MTICTEHFVEVLRGDGLVWILWLDHLLVRDTDSQRDLKFLKRERAHFKMMETYHKVVIQECTYHINNIAYLSDVEVKNLCMHLHKNSTHKEGFDD